ncbi:hypothetical protein AAY473_009316 [Plecturocebus cupreus]
MGKCLSCCKEDQSFQRCRPEDQVTTEPSVMELLLFHNQMYLLVIKHLIPLEVTSGSFEDEDRSSPFEIPKIRFTA